MEKCLAPEIHRCFLSMPPLQLLNNGQVTPIVLHNGMVTLLCYMYFIVLYYFIAKLCLQVEHSLWTNSRPRRSHWAGMTVVMGCTTLTRGWYTHRRGNSSEMQVGRRRTGCRMNMCSPGNVFPRTHFPGKLSC